MNPNHAHNIAGMTAHRGIAHFTHVRRFSPPEIDQWVKDATPAPRSDVSVRVLRRRIGTAIRAYGWDFLLPSPWRLVGAEHRTSSGRFDLWLTDGHRYLVDELKASHLRLSSLHGRAAEQTDRYLAEGVRLVGDRFVGVRCLPLLQPSAAILKTPVGPSTLPRELRGGLR